MEEQQPEVDESGRNLTQRRIDEEGASDEPADAPWDEPLPTQVDAADEHADETSPPPPPDPA